MLLIRLWLCFTKLYIFWQSARITVVYLLLFVNIFDLWRYFKLSLINLAGRTFCKMYCLRFFIFCNNLPGFERKWQMPSQELSSSDLLSLLSLITDFDLPVSKWLRLVLSYGVSASIVTSTSRYMRAITMFWMSCL